MTSATVPANSVRRYADGAADQRAEPGRAWSPPFATVSASAAPEYGRQLTNAAEDSPTRRTTTTAALRRQVKRHPVATVAIVAGTVGAFLLLRRAFSSRRRRSGLSSPLHTWVRPRCPPNEENPPTGGFSFACSQSPGQTDLRIGLVLIELVFLDRPTDILGVHLPSFASAASAAWAIQ